MPPADHSAFGEFVLAHRQQQVRHRDGRVLKLTPRAFDALRLFVERPGELLDKPTLMLALWPGLVVEENNLNQLVSQLRHSLDDDRHASRYIQTVHRRGFRFIANVTLLPAGTVADTSGDALADTAATRPAPGNLPPPAAALRWRAAELSAIGAMLQVHPVVTIVGPGGIGKTRLGLALAQAARPAFEHGVWWIELAAVSSAALLPTAVASALGLQLSPRLTALQALAAALAQQRLLLVLDNCEHLVEAVANLVQALRAELDGLHCLVTSQLPLGLPDEHVFRLGSLGLPQGQTLAAAQASDAVALFVERAAALEPGFGLNPDNVDAVIEVCRRLDGIPLALELAAARVPLLGMHTLQRKLDESLSLLGGGRRTALRRHQTLRAALEWSCALLDPEEASALRRLAVFSGGFTLELAQQLLVDERVDAWQALDLLGRLVDKSLVAVGGGPVRRYRLLETTRSYALEMLAAGGETNACQGRHAQAMLALLQTAQQVRWQALPPDETSLCLELDNARAAFDWSLGSSGDQALAIRLHAASMPLWIATSLKAEGTMRCEALVHCIDEQVDALTAAHFWLTLAMMGLYSSRLECLEAAARAADLFRANGDLRHAFEALIVRTGVAARRSQHADASAALAEAQAITDPAWPPVRRAALEFAGWVSALNAQRLEEAVEHAWRQRALCRDAGLALDEALALGNVGIAEINMPGAAVAGEARLREAMARLAALGKAAMSGKMAYSLSLTLLRRGQLDEALTQARQAYTMLRREGEQGLMLGLMPLLAVRRGQLVDAAHAAGYAAAVYARAGLPSRGLYGEAVAHLQQALGAARYMQLTAEGALLTEQQMYSLVLELRAAA